MLTGLLLLAGAGAALGWAGCRRRGARAWVVHTVMAGAMLVMIVPALDPFGSVGPLVWTLALAALAVWTAWAAAWGDVAPREGHHRGRLREQLDLWLMAFLLLLMPGLHGHHGGHGGTADATGGTSSGEPLGAGPAGPPATGGHTAHLFGAAPGATPLRDIVLALVLFWIAALVTLHLRDRRAGGRGATTSAGTAGSLLSATAMGAMAFAG